MTVFEQISFGRKAIVYIARPDITQDFLTRRPAAPKLQVRIFRSRAPGGCETTTIQPEISNITIPMTPKLFS